MKKVKIHFIGGQFYILGYDQWQGILKKIATGFYSSDQSFFDEAGNPLYGINLNNYTFWEVIEEKK